jgi:transposase InsO family protein
MIKGSQLDRFQIDTWRKYYNEERPHGSLGRLTLTEFAEQVA